MLFTLQISDSLTSDPRNIKIEANSREEARSKCYEINPRINVFTCDDGE